MIQYETNKQLNQFSEFILKSQKMNYLINENKPILIIPGEPNSVFLKFF